MENLVYFFSEGNAEGLSLSKKILGGKGLGLTEMANLGIPIPPGFVIVTDACNDYNKNGVFPDGLLEQVHKKLEQLEKETNCKFGDESRPLLVSVRSGAAVSMPGMMDTVLNLGLNETTLRGMAQQSGNERFACDSYRRFIQMFSNVVLEIEHHKFEEILENRKKSEGVKLDTELTTDALKKIIAEYKELVLKISGQPFPDEVQEQLKKSIEAVFRSWNNERAIIYRRLNHIPDDLGTAVTVQSMVFGNMGDDCATGVAFTRNPSTGENKFYGEYLLNAQGEDVVAGIRTPHPIAELEKDMPEAYAKLMDIQQRLENHFKDMQDLEFTIQQNKLYLLQTRNGKRTGFAALRVAVEMVESGLIDEKTALLRVDPESVPSLLAPVFNPEQKNKALADGRLLAKGLNAGPGAASAIVAFTTREAIKRAKEGNRCILVRKETSPDDIAGMEAADGILTARGGMTSHAAVVARGMNKPCIVGCSSLKIDEAKGIMTMTGEKGEEVSIKEGEQISIDGGTGEVISGHLDTVPSEIHQSICGENKEKSWIAEYFQRFMSWADKERALGIRANADTPRDANISRIYGAQGIGLCRTEHMFFEGKRILAMREMIMAQTVEDREKALAKILPYQKEDFIGIFKEMHDLPVTIRLLDPPLHEFLPHSDEESKELANFLGVSEESVSSRAKALYENNPMLGHRGCRLGITYPEITRMQVRAIIEAAVEVKRKGIKVFPEIMVPLVGNVKEFKAQKEIIHDTAKKVLKENNIDLEYLVGTMIEVPRAAISADRIASEAEFFSFGTNDLTQMTLGFSRDDAHTFLGEYVRKGIYERNPFESIDQEGVGEMIRIAIDKSKPVRSSIKLGVCGEHGGDPKSIQFFNSLGLHYVSCSPFRVPVARLAAAQATLRSKGS